MKRQPISIFVILLVITLCGLHITGKLPLWEREETTNFHKPRGHGIMPDVIVDVTVRYQARSGKELPVKDAGIHVCGTALDAQLVTTNHLGKARVDIYDHSSSRPFRIRIDDSKERYMLAYDQYRNIANSHCGTMEGYLPLALSKHTGKADKLELTMVSQKSYDTLRERYLARMVAEINHQYELKNSATNRVDNQVSLRKQRDKDLRDALQWSSEMAGITFASQLPELDRMLKAFRDGEDYGKSLAIAQNMERQMNQARAPIGSAKANNYKHMSLVAARIATFAGEYEQADHYYSLTIKKADYSEPYIVEHGTQLEKQDRINDAIQLYEDKIKEGVAEETSAVLMRKISEGYEMMQQAADAVYFLEESIKVREDIMQRFRSKGAEMPSPESHMLDEDKAKLERMRKGLSPKEMKRKP